MAKPLQERHDVIILDESDEDSNMGKFQNSCLQIFKSFSFTSFKNQIFFSSTFYVVLLIDFVNPKKQMESISFEGENRERQKYLSEVMPIISFSWSYNTYKYSLY